MRKYPVVRAVKLALTIVNVFVAGVMFGGAILSMVNVVRNGGKYELA